MGKSGMSHFQELTTICTPGREGDVAAATWILHHDYRGALPSSSLLEGWRLRSGDIQVGDNTVLQSLFPESRFNGWCVAETHVLDPRILPNGRRDHFEQNSYYFDLINHLAPHAREIAQRCRTSSISRNLVRTIDKSLNECRDGLRVIERGVVADGAVSKLTAKLNSTLDRLEGLSLRSGIDKDQQIRYQQQIKRLRQRSLRSNVAERNDSVLAHFKSAERTILIEVFNTIYESSDDIGRTQEILDRILSRLKRKRTCLNNARKSSGRR